MSEQIDAIEVSGVSKGYKRYSHPTDRLKEILLPGRSRAEEFWALSDINLNVARGETLGIIGQNGSGKSTLLQIIAGTLTPTQGQVRTSGRVAALLELGSGFNPEFTGRQNVFFNGQILGLSKEALTEKFERIAAFAEIGEFMDEPVKTYSSGMFVRLAFAVAINVEPEILIVDEALAVGDGIFVHRCMAKIKDFQDAGGTILFVSHDVGSVSRLCSKAIWLNEGQIVEQGPPSEVCKHYQAWVYQKVNQKYQSQSNETSNGEKSSETSASNSPAPPKSATDAKETEEIDIEALTRSGINLFTNSEFQALKECERFGSGRGEILSVKVLDATRTPLKVAEPGKVIIVEVSITRHGTVNHPHVGIALLDRLRTVLSGWSTDLLDHTFPKKWVEISPTGTSKIEFEFTWPYLASGTYALDIAFGDGAHDNLEMLDWIQNAVSIQAISPEFVHGLFQVDKRQARIL